MGKDGQNGTLMLRAWSVSIGLHLAVLSIMAVLTFCPAVGHNLHARPSPVALPARVEKILSRPQTTDKPKFELLENTKSSPAPVAIASAAPPEVVLYTLDSHTGKSQSYGRPALKVYTGDFTSDKTGLGTGVFRTEFFGQPTDKRRICYVVDCSGSMHGRLGQVQQQLRKSILGLRQDQFFYIIFFLQGSNLVELDDGKLIRASQQGKNKALAFIENARLGGTTDAKNALERAMQIKDPSGKPPQLIYFLTDGFDLQAGQEKSFPAQIEELRTRLAPEIIINTIGIWTEPSDRAILRVIAESSGGLFVNVD